MSQRGKEAVERILHAFSKHGYPLTESTRVLDLGCGWGESVLMLRQRGLSVWGCDFGSTPSKPETSELVEEGILRTIKTNPYRLPYEDNTFNVVYSDQVLEHVQDYPSTINEIHRLLQPGGLSFHFFPSRYYPIEPHVYIPLGTIVQHPLWLRAWAELGIRNEFQQDLNASETAQHNHQYLTNHTNYLRRRTIERLFLARFKSLAWCEEDVLDLSRIGRKIDQHAPGMLRPFLRKAHAKAYATLRHRALMVWDPIK